METGVVGENFCIFSVFNKGFSSNPAASRRPVDKGWGSRCRSSNRLTTRHFRVLVTHDRAKKPRTTFAFWRLSGLV